jgi:hypothetical protein
VGGGRLWVVGGCGWWEVVGAGRLGVVCVMKEKNILIGRCAECRKGRVRGGMEIGSRYRGEESW